MAACAHQLVVSCRGIIGNCHRLQDLGSCDSQLLFLRLVVEACALQRRICRGCDQGDVGSNDRVNLNPRHDIGSDIGALQRSLQKLL